MKHISYSELKIWAQCPFKHKLIYVDKIREFIGNEYTAFGRALHALCENILAGNLEDDQHDDFFDISTIPVKKPPFIRPPLVLHLEQRGFPYVKSLCTFT